MIVNVVAAFAANVIAPVVLIFFYNMRVAAVFKPQDDVNGVIFVIILAAFVNIADVATIVLFFFFFCNYRSICSCCCCW